MRWYRPAQIAPWGCSHDDYPSLSRRPLVGLVHALADWHVCADTGAGIVATVPRRMVLLAAHAMIVIYVIWRAILVALAFVGWLIGMIVGTFVGGIVGGYMRGYKG